jgi:hypothetical protein
LDWLASDFVEDGNDLKNLILTIATSKTYQLPSVEIKSEEKVFAEDYTFKGMHRRKLSAEQFADAVSFVIYPVYHDTLKVFDPFKKSKAVVTTPQVRAVLVKNDRFLTALGRPNRENVLTERASEANLLQALELTNGDQFNSALESGARKWKSQYKTSEEIILSVYKKALSREPEPDEMKVALDRLGSTPGEDDIEDFLWAVMLLPEFQLIY